MEDLESHVDDEGDYRQPDDPLHHPAGAARSRPVPAHAITEPSGRRGRHVGRVRDVMGIVMVMVMVLRRRKHPRLPAAHVAAVLVAALVLVIRRSAHG